MPTPQLKAEVLGSTRVRKAMEATAARKSVPIKDVEAQAIKILDGMMADIWPNNVRVLAYGARKIWRQMYEGEAALTPCIVDCAPGCSVR